MAEKRKRISDIGNYDDVAAFSRGAQQGGVDALVKKIQALRAKQMAPQMAPQMIEPTPQSMPFEGMEPSQERDLKRLRDQIAQDSINRQIQEQESLYGEGNNEIVEGESPINENELKKQVIRNALRRQAGY